MNTSRRRTRTTSAFLAAATGILLAAAALAATGSSAQAATRTPHLSRSCTSHARVPAKVGRIGGIVHAVSTRSSATCAAHTMGDPAIGTPPLIWHGGPMMSTASTGTLVITPIFWGPSNYRIPASYKKVIVQYLRDVAADSGKHTNVYSTLTEYNGSNGTIRYKARVGNPVDDRHGISSGCTVASQDRSGIYGDGSGYSRCVDDDQIINETERVVTARSLPRDFAHIYVTFLPQHVESCFYPGSTTTTSNFCTINYQPSAAYCAYHSISSTGMVYANMPFPIYNSGTPYSCTDEGLGGGIQSPNGNTDADVEISPTSHEIAEAVTDPDTTTGWYDVNGYENGDECAYVYGALQGTAGQFFNQVIHGHHYLTQEEFSNRDFATSGGGCLQYD
jgi:hypothetical protein